MDNEQFKMLARGSSNEMLEQHLESLNEEEKGRYIMFSFDIPGYGSVASCFKWIRTDDYKKIIECFEYVEKVIKDKYFKPEYLFVYDLESNKQVFGNETE